MRSGSVGERVETLRRHYGDLLDSLGLAAPARRWAGALFHRGLQLADEIEALIGPLHHKRILEIGSAYAGDLLALHARGADCVATDKFDFRYAELRRRIKPLGGFEIVRCDAFRPWPFAGGSFDVVLAMEVVEMVEDLDGFFGEIARVLRPSGLAVLNTCVTLKGIRRDPIYGLPLLCALPNRFRRLIAKQVFRRGSDFRLSNHDFNSARKFARHAGRAGCQARPMKFRDSPLMGRVSRWPLAAFWQRLIRWYAFDFVVVGRQVDTRPPGRTGSPLSVRLPARA